MEQNDNVASLIEQYKRDLMRYRQRSQPSGQTADHSIESSSGTVDQSSEISPSPQQSSSDWEQEAVPAQPSPPVQPPSSSEAPPSDLEPTPPQPASDFPPPVQNDPSTETAIGYLRVEVKTARQALPVEGAQVLVSRVGDEGESLVQTMTTDSNGKTPLLSLPTVPASLSMEPGNFHPYAEYNIRVDKPGYISVRDFSVPVYEGIVAIQPVELSPLPEGDVGGETQDIYESSPANL